MDLDSFSRDSFLQTSVIIKYHETKLNVKSITFEFSGESQRESASVVHTNGRSQHSEMSARGLPWGIGFGSSNSVTSEPHLIPYL